MAKLTISQSSSIYLIHGRVGMSAKFSQKEVEKEMNRETISFFFQIRTTNSKVLKTSERE